MTTDIHAATQVFERALKQTWEMIDPLRPPPAGSYALGEHNGIAAALKTMRENFERECAGATQARDAEIAALGEDAGRYRWLRDAEDLERLQAEQWMASCDPDALDFAIDQARGQTRSPNSDIALKDRTVRAMLTHYEKWGDTEGFGQMVAAVAALFEPEARQIQGAKATQEKAQ